MISSDSHIHCGATKFGLVQSNAEPCIASSIDGLDVLKIDGRLKEAMIKIKSMASAGTKIVSARKVGDLIMLLPCVFGDRNFKEAISSKSYWKQVLHYSLAMKVIIVLIVISDKIKMVQIVLIDVLDYQLCI